MTAQNSISVFKDTVDLKKEETELEKDVKNIVLKAFEGAKVEGISMLSGGITNRLYRIDLIRSGESDPSSVLMRINGQGTEHIIDRDHERNVLMQAHKYGSGPNLFCVFGNGMVYQYFEGRSLSPEDMGPMAQRIAEQMARFHEMDIEVDGDKNKSQLIVQLFDWLDKVKEFKFDNEEHTKRFSKFDLSALENSIREVADMLKDSEIVFCHNDLLSGNILYDSEKDRFYFIDFEYCCYNYAAYDIANHFCEYAGFTSDRANYPKDDQQEAFIKAYLSARTNKEVTDESVKSLKEEVRICAMLSNLYWGVWSIIQAKYSLIDFDYWSYAEERLDWFRVMKQEWDNRQAATHS